MKVKLNMCSLVAAFLLVGGTVTAQMNAPSAFTQLSVLAGKWEATMPDGKRVYSSYEVTSNGSALLERSHMGEEPEMVTVYSPDGDRIAMTHYCSAKNQPQMRTEPISAPGKVFAFSLVRVGNLPDPDAGHMARLVLNLTDNDHLTQEWAWQEKGKDQVTVFHLTRKK